MTTLQTPTERTCEICGRSERWDADSGSWRVDAKVGDVFCIHEWDINGAFAPFEDA